MKIRGLLVAAFVFFILAGFLYWSDHHKPAENSAKASADAPPAILKLDSAGITKLDLKKKDGENVELEKSGSGTWQIVQPKPLGADQSAVGTLVSTLANLNSQRVVEEKGSDLKAFGLDPPALQVDVTEKTGKTHKLLIGDDTPASGGAYAMVAGDPRVFTVMSYGKTSLDKSINDLRDKRLLTVNSDKISRVELVRKNQDIEFGRNKDAWQIVRPQPLRADTFQVDDLVRQLTEAKMDLSAPNPKEADAAFAHGTPVAAVKVTDESGTQQLQVRKNKDAYYAQSSVVSGAYKVDNSLGQIVEKGLDDFRNKKLFDFGFTDPNKIEIHDGSKAYFLSRTGNDWWWNGKKMDPSSMESLISKVRDLSADKFVDTGFANPGIEIVVTSDDGKRVEKIQIAKAGAGYIGKRESEPALYQLASSAVDDLQKAGDDLKPVAAAAKPATPAGK